VLSSWSAIATGMSIGRDGPLIEFGGSLGAALGRATAMSLDRTRVLLPEVAGNGFEPLNAILDQRMLLSAVALLLVAKVFATSASVASGVPGGIFTPMLLIGAALGSLWAQLVGLRPTLTSPSAGSYALVGMAAATAASIHAPLTAALLVFELSGDYAIVLPRFSRRSSRRRCRGDLAVNRSTRPSFAGRAWGGNSRLMVAR